MFALDRLEAPLCAKVSVLINWLIHSQKSTYSLDIKALCCNEYGIT